MSKHLTNDLPLNFDINYKVKCNKANKTRRQTTVTQHWEQMKFSLTQFQSFMNWFYSNSWLSGLPWFVQTLVDDSLNFSMNTKLFPWHYIMLHHWTSIIQYKPDHKRVQSISHDSKTSSLDDVPASKECLSKLNLSQLALVRRTFLKSNLAMYLLDLHFCSLCRCYTKCSPDKHKDNVFAGLQVAKHNPLWFKDLKCPYPV